MVDAQTAVVLWKLYTSENCESDLDTLVHKTKMKKTQLQQILDVLILNNLVVKDGEKYKLTEVGKKLAKRRCNIERGVPLYALLILLTMYHLGKLERKFIKEILGVSEVRVLYKLLNQGYIKRVDKGTYALTKRGYDFVKKYVDTIDVSKELEPVLSKLREKYNSLLRIRVLQLLDEHREGLTSGELGEMLNKKVTSLSSAIAYNQKKGYLLRDENTKKYKITDKGIQYLSIYKNILNLQPKSLNTVK